MLSLLACTHAKSGALNLWKELKWIVLCKLCTCASSKRLLKRILGVKQTNPNWSVLGTCGHEPKGKRKSYASGSHLKRCIKEGPTPTATRARTRKPPPPGRG
eukprot:1157915-Pelagomonas_calceolata.AAC.4